MKTFRIAVIGCGSISGNHINAIVGSGNKVCALCDILPEHAEEKSPMPFTSALRTICTPKW